MQLKEFIARFETMGDDAFQVTFPHPFLLEAGPLLGQGPQHASRHVFMLRPDRGALSVGRKPSADIQVALNSVSSRHALIRPPAPGRPTWTIEDDSSTNGTYLDGAKLTPHKATPLQDGAALRFGPGSEARFTFLEASSFLRAFRRLVKAEGAGVAGDPNPHLAETDPILRNLAHQQVDGDATLAVSGGGGANVELMLMCEPFDPLPLREGEAVVLGRSPGTANLVLPDKNVSRRHAEIVRRGDVVTIRDLGSANGTFIGKTRVGEQAMELGIGKHVSVGPYTLMVSGPIEALAHTSVVPLKEDWRAMVEGDLSRTSVLDVFNEIEMAQVTGILRVESGAVRALISFRGGEPIGAETSTGEEGDGAVRKVMALDRGKFWLNPEARVYAPERVSRRVTRSFSELALDDFFGKA